MARSEQAGQFEMRARLLAQARGSTLEIGAGNGFNLPHYTPAVDELVLTEPSPAMLDLLRTNIADHPPTVGTCRLVETGAEVLPFDDDSFDTVTSAYVQCTVPHPSAALREIARVLRPGGTYLFLEHVRGDGLRGRAQDLVSPLHVLVAAGCHPNRRFLDLVSASPLALRDVEHGRMPRGFPTVAPIVLGSATA